MSRLPQDGMCKHENLIYEPSPHAAAVGYRSHTAAQLSTAAGKNKNGSIEPSDTFPAPLVLPGDELAEDPRYPSQSFRSWLRAQDRTGINPKRRIIYVAAPPETDVDFIRLWGTPGILTQKAQPSASKRRILDRVSPPDTKDVIDYLAAFYHGMPVKQLPISLKYSTWDQDNTKAVKSRSKTSVPPFIALNTAQESIRISARACPDDLFSAQLGLNDVLDVAISLLPDDAYALLMLVNHDLFEDEDDDFCCGRAYGGSHVAVVSSARYNPVLDTVQGIDREHAWPASHCEEYVKDCCTQGSQPSKKARVNPTPARKTNITPVEVEPSKSGQAPMRTAIQAHSSIPSDTWSDYKYPTNLWLSRLTRTASHELGHCFGIDHCGYYACIMQGTASMIEDVRQPPYLCPVDLAKIQRVLALSDADVTERYRALRAYCGKFGHAFAGFEGWLEGRLTEQ